MSEEATLEVEPPGPDVQPTPSRAEMKCPAKAF